MRNVAILTVVFCLAVNVSQATNYYFSSSSGNDSYTATQAQSQSTPWKTIVKINAVMTSLKPGDSILFKKGDTFLIPEGINTGGLLVKVSGTSTQPIVFSSYGTGALPIITLPPLTTWAAGATAGIYKDSFTIQTCCSFLSEDGIPLTKASSTALTDGNWYGSGGVVYYKPTSGTPSSHTVTVANINNSYIPGIDLSDQQYITVNGIQFNSLGVGVKTYDLTTGTIGLTIQNCVFNYCQTGIFFMPDVGNNTNSTFKNNVFYRDQCAIRMYTTSATGNRPGQTWGTHIRCKILNNQMNQIGTTDGATHWPSSITGTDFEAIGLQNFMNGTVQGNTTTGGYHIGLSWYNITSRESSNDTIKGNTFISTGKQAVILIGDQVNGVYNYAYNNNLFCNNVFVNTNNIQSGNPTFQIYQGVNATTQNLLVNNTFVGNINTWYFSESNAPYFIIENNLVYNAGSYRWVEWSWGTKPASLTVAYNMYYEDSSNSAGTNCPFAFGSNKSITQMQTLLMESHSVAAVNPVFTNPASGTYTLQSTSPAIDAGVNVGLPFSGKAPDIGAYEYVAASAPPPPPASVKPPNPAKKSGTPVVY
ncbi:MAG TPA: choice-of-anchor Q domain-containing protein [Mucilaginibacter sp.]|jgi:hypothetical protein|nr:choice-of-anchor Q domain-containing protein [Mucilaginibacter sp.]